MLTANQFTVGSLADAQPLSLVMPRRPGGPFVLVGWRGQEVVGLFVGPENSFRSIRCAGTASWVGLIVSNVRVEVDPTSMFDPSYDDAPSGALVRRDTRLVAQAARDSMSGPLVVTLADELEDAGGQEAGFRHWQIVVGEGLDKQVLHTVDIRPRAASA
jgi:hypothetical protein